MAVQKPQTPGIAEILSAGFSAVNRAPGILLIPLLVNLWLWFSPGLSLAPLGDVVRDRVARSAAPQVQQALAAWLPALAADARGPLIVLNVVPMLPVNRWIAAEPVIEGGIPPLRVQTVRADLRGLVALGTPGELVLAAVLLNAGTLAASGLFLAVLARVVRGGPLRAQSLPSETLGIGVRLLGWWLLLGGVSLLLGLPFMCAVGVLALAAPSVSGLALALLLGVWLWVQLYTGFAVEAIALYGDRPVRAVYHSVNVVRRHFWGSIALVLASTLITSGLAVLWYGMVGSSAGLVVALLGSVYVGGGLAAARLVFYQDRLQRWQASRRAIGAQVAARREDSEKQV